MWVQWLPWRFVLKRIAQAKGFIDPVELVAQFNRFSQPSEVIAPVELLREGLVMQARGFINSQAIQHNLDWIWPYWVEQQFNPDSRSFIPRAFSVTHINLTHRNWTAVGIPGFYQMPVIDPCGLVMPFYDSWSLDFWICNQDSTNLYPSRTPLVQQRLFFKETLCVETAVKNGRHSLQTIVSVEMDNGRPACVISIRSESIAEAWCAITIRPFNPEGVSFIHSIKREPNGTGIIVNNRETVCLDKKPERCLFSNYNEGDVKDKLYLPETDRRRAVSCKIGMATAAFLYKIEPFVPLQRMVHIPLLRQGKEAERIHIDTGTGKGALWDQRLRTACTLAIPDGRMQFLFDTAVKTIVLFAPDTVFAGPYTYKRFWFRDAAIITYALVCAGLLENARRVIDRFISRQHANGYFKSQSGEWDSNGQVLWVIREFVRCGNLGVEAHWRDPIRKAADWIIRKRLPVTAKQDHAGLMPAGFSAEHLGPNDFYYWDNFWSAGGLLAAAQLTADAGDSCNAVRFGENGNSLLDSIAGSLQKVRHRTGVSMMPSSPYRRMDSSAIGSLSAGYPLQLWSPHDERIMETAHFLLQHCMIHDVLFHDISHAGLNPYLTLALAQVLLRAGDQRFFKLVQGVARLASPTGQWPEAMHPQLGTGCMGDGQHVWAAAEWVIMMRNCFVREEMNENSLILCSGIPRDWLAKDTVCTLGPVPTAYGKITVSIESGAAAYTVRWNGAWHNGREPSIQIRLPFKKTVVPEKGVTMIAIPRYE